jgi:hypothetical protein
MNAFWKDTQRATRILIQSYFYLLPQAVKSRRLCVVFVKNITSFCRLVLRLSSPQILLDRLDHLVADFVRFGEARTEVALDFLEFLAVAFEVAEGDAVGPVLVRDVSLDTVKQVYWGWDLREQQM